MKYEYIAINTRYIIYFFVNKTDAMSDICNTTPGVKDLSCVTGNANGWFVVFSVENHLHQNIILKNKPSTII